MLGEIKHFYSKIKVAEVDLGKLRVKNGDEYIIIGPKTGVIRGKFRNIKIDGSILTFKIGQKVRKNDKLFLVEK